MNDVTKRFQELSEGVRQAALNLKAAGLADAATLVNQLQQKEKEKLEVVCRG